MNIVLIIVNPYASSGVSDDDTDEEMFNPWR
jgi:hypothetical protein